MAIMLVDIEEHWSAVLSETGQVEAMWTTSRPGQMDREIPSLGRVHA